MKVLQINPYYQFGSTGKIVYDIDNYIRRNKISSYVCYAWETGSKKNDETIYFKYGNIVEKYINALLTRLTGNRYGYSWIETKKLIRFLKKYKPDVVHIHCINTYDVNIYKLLSYLKNASIPTVITEHAEFFHTGNCPYAFDCEKWVDGCWECDNLYYATKSRFFDTTAKNWNRMKLAFNGFEKCVLVPVSPWLCARAQRSGITSQIRAKTILNGINTDVFRYYSNDEVLEKLKSIFTKKSVLFVTSDFNEEIKGAKYVIELAKQLKEYNFIIVCSAKVTVKEPNIIHIPYVSNQVELAQMYSLADVTILCSKRETFSMVVAESLSCGTPVVGFEAGGPESISIDKYSTFVEYGNTNELKNSLVSWITRNVDKAIISKEAKEKYSSDIMGENYLSLYRELAKDDE